MENHINEENSEEEGTYKGKTHYITLSVEKFKEILIHGWNLLPRDKQEELLAIGLKPKKT